MDSPKAVVLLSGGMDSTTLLYDVLQNGYEAYALSVAYGQRHSVELQYAARTTAALGVDHRVIDLLSVRELLAASALTGRTPVPEGHYSAASMAQTVVPNRNAILLAIAYGWAVTLQAKMVATAVHKGDWAQYPDCRPAFVKGFEEMEREAITRETYGISTPRLYAPYVMETKDAIVGHGHRLGVPWEMTWSCYLGDAEAGQCGRCGTCVERVGAFNRAGVDDPTVYQDKDFAVRVLREAGEWVE